MEQDNSKGTQSFLTIDIPWICRRIARYLYLIIMCTMIAGCAAYVVMDLISSDSYTVSVQLTVVPRDSSTSKQTDNNVNTAVTRCVNVLTSDTMSRLLSENAEGGEISGTTSAVRVGTTNLITLSATAGSAENAFRLLKLLMECYPQLSDYYESGYLVQSLTTLSADNLTLTSSNPLRYGVLAALLVFVGGVGLVVLQAMISDRIYSRTQAENLLDISVAGELSYVHKQKGQKALISMGMLTLNAMPVRAGAQAYGNVSSGTSGRAGRDGTSAAGSLANGNGTSAVGARAGGSASGAAGLLTNWNMLTSVISDPTWSEDIDRLTTHIKHRMESNHYHTLMITSMRENEGKSTVAVNVALNLARRGKRVLLVDGDMRRPAIYRIFEAEVPEGHSFSDCLSGSCSYAEAGVKLLGDGLLGLSSAGSQGATSAGTWSTSSATAQGSSSSATQGLEDFFTVIMQKKAIAEPDRLLEGKNFSRGAEGFNVDVDYIIIDTPPFGIVRDAEIIAETIDAALLVFRQDKIRAVEINDTVDLLERAGTHVIGGALNMVKGKQSRRHKSYGYGYYYGYSYDYGHRDKDSAGSRHGDREAAGSGYGNGDTAGSRHGNRDSASSGHGYGNTAGSDHENGDTVGSGHGNRDSASSGHGYGNTAGSGHENGDTVGSGHGNGNTTGSGHGNGDFTGIRPGNENSTGSNYASEDFAGAYKGKEV